MRILVSVLQDTTNDAHGNCKNMLISVKEREVIGPLRYCSYYAQDLTAYENLN